MENRLDRERRDRRKKYQRAKEYASARREATKEWLRQVTRKLQDVARHFRMRLTKHPGRFLIREGEVDVLSIWWGSGKVSHRWHGPEDIPLMSAVGEVLREHPRG